MFYLFIYFLNIYYNRRDRNHDFYKRFFKNHKIRFFIIEYKKNQFKFYFTLDASNKLNILSIYIYIYSNAIYIL